MTGTLRQPEDVLFRELQGEAVIMNAATGRYYGLDAVGTRMWQELLRHGEIEGACRTLLDEFDVAEDRLRSDLEELTSKLLERQLLEVGSG